MLINKLFDDLSNRVSCNRDQNKTPNAIGIFIALFFCITLFLNLAETAQATTFMVTKTADTNDGICDADCSLREAIANANTTSTQDNTIIFDANMFATPQTITLNGSEIILVNNGTLLINGAGANLLTISGNNRSRVFSINAGANITIKGVTITGGNAAGISNNGFGGSIINNGGTLSLINSTVRNNTASEFGGGIYNNDGGTLRLNNSIVSSNFANGNGGGVYNNNSTAAIINSTLDSNTSNSGGGIYSLFGTVTMTNTTVNSNIAELGGGGIVNVLATMNLINSTISTNKINSGFGGGGINNDNLGTLNISNSTIANNRGYNGGGIRNNSGVVNVINTIIADNIDSLNTAPDFSGTLTSQGYILLENTNSTIIVGTTTGNILGQDPQLLPLGNYGGTTKTHALRPISPAIDKGNGSRVNTDQRSKTRPLDNPYIPNSTGGDGSDIGAFERQTSESIPATPFDFDGDGKTDISVFRPSAGEWWYLKSFDGSNSAAQFGTETDTPVPADFTGDGKTDIAFWRSLTGQWFILRSEDQSFYTFPFGADGDIPAPGDFDGDGKADAAVFRPSTATWFIVNSSSGLTTIFEFGTTEDKPVIADYDGDGKSDIALFRPFFAEWWILRSTGGAQSLRFGLTGDRAVPGDYTRDGKADMALWRPTTGEWIVLRSDDNSFYAFQFGNIEDIPAPGDYDGDRKFDVAVYRPSSYTWFIQLSTAGTSIREFGTFGDMPLPNAFVR